jgi:hypothetical protein
MTLALRTATSRTPSYAAELVLGELEDGFARLGYRPADGSARMQHSSPLNRVMAGVVRHPVTRGSCFEMGSLRDNEQSVLKAS